MSVESAHRDCVVMFTHQWNERIARHFDRLKRQAGTVLPVFLVAHVEGQPLAGAPVDITVSLADAQREWPIRHAAYRQENRGHPFGYVDMLWLTAFRHPRLAEYDRFWLVEYDVDFSGDWARLFHEASAYQADLLPTHLRRRDEQPQWNYLSQIVDPLGRPQDHVIGLFSISRFSRRFIDYCHAELTQPGWSGHFELVLPTIAARGGFKIEDLGGSGSYTPRDRRNKHYEGDFNGLQRGFYTHAFRPPRMWHYFAESRLGFWQPNRIYHPIKLGGTSHTRWGARMMIMRDRLRAWVAHVSGREPEIRARRKK